MTNNRPGGEGGRGGGGRDPRLVPDTGVIPVIIRCHTTERYGYRYNSGDLVITNYYECHERVHDVTKSLLRDH